MIFEFYIGCCIKENQNHQHLCWETISEKRNVLFMRNWNSGSLHFILAQIYHQPTRQTMEFCADWKYLFPTNSGFYSGVSQSLPLTSHYSPSTWKSLKVASKSFRSSRKWHRLTSKASPTLRPAPVWELPAAKPLCARKVSAPPRAADRAGWQVRLPDDRTRIFFFF